MVQQHHVKSTNTTGGELRDDQLSASQLKARYARVISPDERRSRFSRLSVAVVVVVMAAELVIKCCRAAAYVIREALSLKLLGELLPALDVSIVLCASIESSISDVFCIFSQLSSTMTYGAGSMCR